MSKQIFLVLLCLALAAFVLPATSLAQGPGPQAPDAQPGVVAPKQLVFGKSYSEWSAEWYEWQFAIPVSLHPANDPTGTNCKRSENYPVFFLSGSMTSDPVTRACKVSASKPILIPLLTAECSNVQYGDLGKNGKLRAKCASDIIDGLGTDTLKASLDGATLKHLTRFRFASPKYKFTMPAQDNLLGLDGVTSGRSNANGYFLMLEPLSAGTHTVHWEAALTSGPKAGFSQSITYTLEVKP